MTPALTTPPPASPPLSPRNPATYAAAMQRAAGETDLIALTRRIIAASPNRDSAAESDFCRCFAPRIRLFGLKRLRDDAAAADLVQDVLILTLDKLRAGEVREPAQIGAFVYGIARQLVIDSRRTSRRREQLLDTFSLDIATDSGTEASFHDTKRLAHCLQALAERERAVLVMTFYDDCGADEVGRQLGLTPVNVRVIRHRGIERLRACVQRREATQ